MNYVHKFVEPLPKFVIPLHDHDKEYISELQKAVADLHTVVQHKLKHEPKHGTHHQNNHAGEDHDEPDKEQHPDGCHVDLNAAGATHPRRWQRHSQGQSFAQVGPAGSVLISNDEHAGQAQSEGENEEQEAALDSQTVSHINNGFSSLHDQATTFTTDEEMQVTDAASSTDSATSSSSFAATPTSSDP
ncbi:unnamed protein product [Amoebophrya sp. A120]|nr:unnamed protein product [Amoebophrya sp. A120]|eukprot:GSA120T00001159001.1